MVVLFLFIILQPALCRMLPLSWALDPCPARAAQPDNGTAITIVISPNGIKALCRSGAMVYFPTACSGGSPPASKFLLASLRPRSISTRDEGPAPFASGLSGFCEFPRMVPSPVSGVVCVGNAVMPATAFADRAVFEAQVKKYEFKPDMRALVGELKKGEEIFGADLKFGGLRLVIG